MDTPCTLAVFSVIILKHADQYLLLRRSETKDFAPGRWTGIGGRAEAHELTDLRASAFRELFEETGISGQNIRDFVLRRVLLHARSKTVLTMLLYFTGTLTERILPASPEGMLAWMTPEDLAKIDVIESTRPVLPLLLTDQERDPTGQERLRLGVAHYQDNGMFEQIVWA